MDVTEACEHVNGLALMPGLNVEARDFTHRFDDSIAIRITFVDGPSSDVEHAPDYSAPADVQGGPRSEHVIYVGDCGHDELTGRVIDQLVGAFCHEVREFTRSWETTTWRAPFHPHQHAGQLAWSARTGDPVLADLAYGVIE